MVVEEQNKKAEQELEVVKQAISPKEEKLERIEEEQYIYKQVRSIVFSILSPKMIKKMASAKIVTPELYDKEGYPVDGGLMDIRLGVIDPGLRCKTCGSKLKECIGHFGYIELARPIIHVKFVNIILTLIKCTCRECGRILVPDNKISKIKELLDQTEKDNGIEERRQKVKEIIAGLKTTNKCPHCKSKQKKITLEKPTTFLEDEKRLSPIEIRARLEKIPDADCEIFGLRVPYVRPEWMVLTVLAIPPVTMRPSITLESGERSEDDLTHKLGDIVRINQRLFENINAGAPEIIVEDLWDLLQYHVTTFFDNNIAQLPPARHRSGQPLKTLTERIKSKEGRIRHNLAGKRTNFSARTVISPDPMLELFEVGVPFVIATKLTVPERVNDWNIQYLKRFVENGPDKYPGANYVIRPDGKKKKITEETKEASLEELQPGYVVERHLMDGDIAIFNRQPSLHRMSMMCHRVKILPGKTLRLNPAVCVAPDTLVQLSSGILRPIDELKNCWKESELTTYDNKKDILTKTELKKFWGLKPEEYGAKCYKITTESGRTITATGDHPFYVKKSIENFEKLLNLSKFSKRNLNQMYKIIDHSNSSIKKTADLKRGDLAIIRPLDAPVYEEVDRVLATEEDILKNSPKETYTKHTLKILSELKLIPLNLIDQRTMIIARLLGHLFGDGTFILKKDSGRMIFRGSKKDLETIQKDIESLGFKPEKIYIKTVDNRIETIKGKILNVKGSGCDFEIRHKPLCILFSSLGAPNGDKVKSKYRIPNWIQRAPAHIQREFLAAYFGSEMSTPKLRKNSKSNFRSIEFKISKIDANLDSGKEFVNDIGEILKRFDIKLKINRIEDGNKRKDGYLTKVIIASIDDEKSKANLFGRLGYIYDFKKDNVARLAYHYALLKQKEITVRNRKYFAAKDLRNNHVKFKDISKKLAMSIGMPEKWTYGKHKAGLPNTFVGFLEWCEKSADTNNGFVYDKIIDVQETYVPFVYDVTTTLETHNFFANGFLTGNCTPYNADFDGDEMNLHIPQTEEARSEAEILMEVQTQLISLRYGLSIIGCTQDSISGNYLLTKDSSIKREHAIDLLSAVGITDFSKLPRKAFMTGKEVFSVLLPDDFHYSGHSRLCDRTKEKCDKDTHVVIEDGKLLLGVMDRNSLGEESGLMLRSMHQKYGKDFSIDVLGKIFRLGIEYLLRVGFTSGLSDTDLPESAKLEIKEDLDAARREVDSLIKQFNDGKLEAFPGKTMQETLELKILEVLNKARNQTGRMVASHADKKSHTMIMAESGARGNLLNLAQMAACVGQQAMRGKRIEKGFEQRTLSHFRKGDLSSESHGFIANGFKNGLSPAEFFFGSMTGRDSLMDTALRTPKSGYLYRRLANAMQDLKVEYDNTVRDASRKIIQFEYGEDGIDVSKSENGMINVKRIIQTS